MKYFLIAGEASGDLHGAHLMHELKNLDAKAEFCFLGGDLMQAEGGTMVKHYREMAFMGFIAVIKNGKKLMNNLKECKKTLRNFQPDILILIDYPSFNLRIAKFAKKELQLPVCYYISPKVWAWKTFRIKQIKQYVDKMLVIFPFEVDFYAQHHYEVEYVGNPTVDAVFSSLNQNQTFEDFCLFNGIEKKPVIALLAGSRKQEISTCLPKMVETASQFNDFQLIIAGAPGIELEFYQVILKNKNIKVVFEQTYQLLLHAKAAIVNSGTATLETALIGTPQVVVYSVAFGRLAYWAKNIFIKVKYISLVNLIAGREVVKELIAHLFTVENLTRELKKLLYDEAYRTKIQENYQEIKNILGDKGAAQRAAKKIIAFCEERKKN